MPQRKDTPAARAALARRRQRAAQTLGTTSASAISGSTTTSASEETMGSRISSTMPGATLPANPPRRISPINKPTTTKAADEPSQPEIQFSYTNKSVSPWDEVTEAPTTLSSDREMRLKVSGQDESNDITGGTTNTTRDVSRTNNNMRSSVQKFQSNKPKSSASTPAEKILPTQHVIRTATPSENGGETNKRVFHDGTPADGSSIALASTKYTNERQKDNDDEQQQSQNSELYPQQKLQNKSPDKTFERISNFGYIEKLSPQPMVPDRRNLMRYQEFPSSDSKTITTPVPTSGHENTTTVSVSTHKDSYASLSEEIQVPLLDKASRPGMSSSLTDKSTNDRNTLISVKKESPAPKSVTAKGKTEIVASNSKSKIGGSSSSRPKPTQRPTFASRTRRIVEKKEAASSNLSNKPKFSDTSKVHTSSTSDKVSKRVSRIPTSTTNVLPKRNASPKRSVSPEKRLSPHRFRLPPKGKDDEQSKLWAASGYSTYEAKKISVAKSQEKSSLRLPDSTPKSPGATRPIKVSHNDSSVQSNSKMKLRPVPKPAQTTLSPIRPVTHQSHVSSPKVEDLSNYLMDSCSIAESMILDIQPKKTEEFRDPVIQSRNSNLGEGMTRPERAQPQISNDAPTQNSSPIRSNQVIETYQRMNHSHLSNEQPKSSNLEEHGDEIERHRISAHIRVTNADFKSSDGIAPSVASTLSVTPKLNRNNNASCRIEERSTIGINPPVRTVQDSQGADAACLHSGDIVMVRSCSLSATIQMSQARYLAQVAGPCLGKDTESLRITKVEDNGTSTLRFGDLVLLHVSTAEGTGALGSRRRQNDSNGKYDIGFYGDGSEDSTHWIIHSAESGVEILVGRAAVSGDRTTHRGPHVRSGNSVLLMNYSNGGILSIQDREIVLLTDSYDSYRNGFSGDSGLLGRLERHDRLKPSLSETFQLLRNSIPPCPTWAVSKGVGERLFLNGSYLSEPMRNEKENIFVDSNLPPVAKENVLVDEIIGSFLGLEGLYIRLRGFGGLSTPGDQSVFQLFDGPGITFDLSLRNLVEQILPLSTAYVRVRNFIGSHHPGYEYGRVMQAFCEGLDSFLQQFVSFVAQLEHKIRKPPSNGMFTMKNVHFEITPLLHSMSILEHTTKVVQNKKGGALINALRSLEKRVYMGDTVAKDLLGTLLDRSSAPYAEMLTIWLQSGRIYDPYEEFMIQKTSKDKQQVNLDGDTWSSLFKINEDHVIRDIVRNEKLKTKILVAGKYWNAVRACVVDAMTSQETSSSEFKMQTLQFQSDLSGISSYIDAMYEEASDKLMELLKDKFKLTESLRIMKRYFLLDQADFLVNFLETAEDELAKPKDEVSIGRVQHFLGISVQLTESQRDEENCFYSNGVRMLSPSILRCRLSDQSLVSYLETMYGGFDYEGPNTPSKRKYGSPKQGTAGFDFFEIDFPRVPFPISLIISPTSMVNYKTLFRHLFFAKHVERHLVGVWSDHQLLKKLDSVRGLLGPTYILRQRMLHFVQNLMNYMTFEVVESNWLEMISLIDNTSDTKSDEKKQTVDDLLNIHDGFLQKTIDACLLRNPVLIKSLIKLLNTCLLFTDQMKRFMDTTKIHDDSFTIAAEKRDAVQKKLNERLSSQRMSRDMKKLQRTMMSVKEERDILLQRQTRRVGREICSESYKRMIHRFEEVFSADLSAFMTQLNSHTYSGIVANLGIRLDWNGFVSNSMAHRNRGSQE